MSGSPPIRVVALRKVFRQTTGQPVVAIAGLECVIAPHEIVAIVGQTGCGKSTFFNILLGVETPTSGCIDIGGQTPYGDFAAFRGRISMVFQQDRLLPWRSALDNVRLGLEILGLSKAEQRRRAAVWLERVGLAGFRDAFPHELSGGMRQRVAIARAFAVQPQILLADEAFGHLDAGTALHLRTIFVELARETQSTAVLITHQLEEALLVGERILVFGKPARLLADIRLHAWAPGQHALLRDAIQQTLQSNACDPRLERG